MKYIFSVVLFAAIILSSFGFDIDEGELEKYKDSTITFTNYEGPHDRIDSLAAIIDIGTQIGQDVDTAENPVGAEGTYGTAYKVIHAPGTPEEEGINADIFIITAQAGVDHIANLRYIIAGYLQATYAYTLEDAYLLAKFITYYNAVYRGNYDHFAGSFKASVVNYLEAGNVGLSTFYYDWPGKTQMIIPLTDRAGKGELSSIDSTEITDKEVIEDIREDDGKALDDRKEIVDFQEREIEKEEAAIAEEEKAIDEETTRIDEEKEQVQEEKEQVQEDIKEVDEKIDEVVEEIAKIEEDIKEADTQEEKEALEDTKENLEEAKTDLEATKEELEETEAAIEEKEETLIEEEAAVEERKEDLEERKEDLDEKEDALVDQRETIAEDEKAIIEEEIADTTTTVTETVKQPVYFLLASGDSRTAGSSIIVIDAATGDRLAESTLTVYGRMFHYTDSGIIVVSNEGKSMPTLKQLDINTLEVSKSGTDTIYEGSEVWSWGSDIYAIVNDGSTYTLGKFDADLKLAGRSAESVNPFTSVSFVGTFVLVQGTDNTILILSQEDLSLVSTVK